MEMKKVWIGIVLVGVLVAAFAATGLVLAQAGAPQGTQGNSQFGMGLHGMMANSQGLARTGEGPLHDYMVAAFADQLGLTVDEINQRLSDGEHMVDIALDQGLTLDEFRALMLDIRAQALEQAVADGVITQEQADWMSTRGGMRGGMRGSFGGNFTNCPMVNQSGQ